jgi:hypothetical protein
VFGTWHANQFQDPFLGGFDGMCHKNGSAGSSRGLSINFLTMLSR